MTEQISYFLIPSVSRDIPLLPLIDSIEETRNSHSIWLLYSFLSISEQQIRMSITFSVTYVGYISFPKYK